MIRLNRKNKKVKGFTLVELIVVIAIIGILAVILVPTLFGEVKESKQATANANAKIIYDTITKDMVKIEADGVPAMQQSTYDTLVQKGKAGLMNPTNPMDLKNNFSNHVFFNLDTSIGGYINAYFSDGELVSVAWSDGSGADATIGRYPDPVKKGDNITWSNWAPANAGGNNDAGNGGEPDAGGNNDAGNGGEPDADAGNDG